MSQSVPVTLSETSLAGLFFIQRYRFLTTPQYARATGLHYSTAAAQLRQFARVGILGFFGNTRLAGNGKTPKAYYLTRRGCGRGNLDTIPVAGRAHLPAFWHTPGQGEPHDD
jgi:hypothetical protein